MSNRCDICGCYPIDGVMPMDVDKVGRVSHCRRCLDAAARRLRIRRIAKQALEGD